MPTKILPNIEIRAQSPEEEFTYLKWVLNQLSWYKNNGYKIVLPQLPLLQTPIEDKEVANRFKLFISQEYNADFYKNGISALEENRWRFEKALHTLADISDLWEFRLYPQYFLKLTKYGPGGAYYVDTGQIVMQTTIQGTFKRPHPSHTPIHEIIHLGIEESIVKKFKLTHWEKERTVDLITLNLFAELLPGYTAQERGDKKIDNYVTKVTVEALPSAFETFAKDFPR